MGLDDASRDTSSKKGSCLSVFKTLSVEPAGFLVICSIIMSHLMFQNLLMETACRGDLGYEAATCKEIITKVNASYKTQEREIQKVVADLQAITSVLFGSISVLVVLFIGPWSDSNGRKIPLLISCMGMLSFSGMMILCYFLLDKVKLNALTLTLLVMGPITLSGGGHVFGMSAYSYIADTTSEKSRTLRTGVLSASVRSAMPIGYAIGGGLNKFGVKITTSLMLAMGLGLVGFVILLLTVKNVRPKNTEVDDVDGSEVTKRKKRSAWIRYNPLTKLWQAFAILWKKRKDRVGFWLLIVAHMSYAAPGSGEYSMLYLFVRERLQWNVSDYGFFSMYNWLMSAAGVFLSMFILSRKLKISDPIVGLVAGFSQIGGSTMYAFATTALAMYLASATDLMNGTIGVVVRSMLSKTVAPDEIGKLFALLGVLESLIPIGMVPTYAMLYKNTVTIFAGAFFLLSAALTIPAEIIFIYFICTKRNMSPKKEEHALDGELGPSGKPLVVHKGALEDRINNELVRLMPQEMYSSKDCMVGVFEAKNAVKNDNDDEEEK
ncbi:solute carrier family 46 member 3 [Folsomia candida]|uniref:Proton-coupled folate transporter n=1 Tax=Folsomia candida TaxID=158441 RepID=A0A226EXM5_FOLCA|nr:solute carrier family 46 member 3 [Folsomia candida]OXA62353.1 Proton-coupled folate transporter [Folsomia candida]